jgi:hypothetical protein
LKGSKVFIAKKNSIIYHIFKSNLYSRKKNLKKKKTNKSISLKPGESIICRILTSITSAPKFATPDFGIFSFGDQSVSMPRVFDFLTMLNIR